ncbi:unnamed protein product [Moneuplotes crassus]|uniref:ABC transporter domain-containing protein n=3 Tax=Euplotes crassus TaxID=5936 RepID=A0AAD2DA51_EUPCR|nr:unnamed protein product [Moneuplotes crassus]
MSKIFRRQLSALNKKNWLIYKRNKGVILVEFLLPLIIMAFVVSIKKSSMVIDHEPTSYELYGFYAHQSYSDESFLFKSSMFTCPPGTAIGIIGGDKDEILKDTLKNLYLEEKKSYSALEEHEIINFDNTKEFYNYIRQYKDVESPPNITKLCFGAEMQREGKQYNLKIHVMYLPSGDSIPFEQGDSLPKLFGGYSEMKNSHMSTFTMAVSEVIASRYEKDVDHEFRVAFVPRKTGAFRQDYFSSGMSQTFSPLVVVIFLAPFMNFYPKALDEKVNRMKEYMRMMGMKDSAYVLSWAIYYTLQIFIVSLEMAIVTSLYLATSSSFILVFLFFFMYGVSLFGFILSLVAIFNNKRTGSAAGVIIHFATFYIVHAVPKSAGYYSRLLSSFIPNMAMSQGVEVLWKLEDNEAGLNFSTMTHLHKNFNISSYFFMCLVNTVLYTLIAIYLTYTLPNDYGLRKHPLFCILPSSCKKRSKKGNYSRLNDNHEEIDMEEIKKNTNFEPVPPHFKNRDKLSIRKLVKVYDNGLKAVDDLSLTMYKDQIFALLGPNGAGKTSTISIITGLYEATEGEAEVFGANIFDEMDKIRENLGVCPQYNVLFDQLTPEEHFNIFCEFKGVSKKIRRRVIQEMLEECDLEQQKELLSKNLSGGQKRKVNVGIALLGGSKLVLLDEPSSGLDPTARRRLWDMLKKNKQDRIIILTTHFMEEADILGDRIAIMTKGRASCCGSSLFLKKKFGVGYNLTIDKIYKDKAPQIDAFILNKISTAQKLSEVSSEMTYQLPNDSVKNFKEFFKALDENKLELGLKSYGIGVTTLEEVFLKVCEGRQIDEIDDFSSKETDRMDQDISDSYCLLDESVSGFHLDRLQIFAMISARLKMIFRHIRPIVFEILYPSLLIIFGALVLTLSVNASNRVTTVSMNDFPMKQEFSYSEYEPNVNPDLSKDFVEGFFKNDVFTPIHFEMDQEGDIKERFSRLDQILLGKSKQDQSYGSAYIKEIINNATTNLYDIITVLDINSAGVLPYFTGFMSNALLKHSTGDEEISLNLSYGGFPQSKLLDNVLSTTMAIMTVISFSLSVGSITSAIAANLVSERNDAIKYQQMISGGSLFSYWFSVYFVDILKFILPAASFVIITYTMDFSVDYSWILLIMMIIAVLPFTYLLTFFFKKDNTARTAVSYLQFFFGGFMALIIFAFQMLSSEGFYIKIFKWICRFQPGFSFCNAIVQMLMKDIIPDVKETSLFSLDKVGGDILMLCICPFLYFFVMYLIETECVTFGQTQAETENLDLDEDVLDEERRLDHSLASDYQVRVKNLNKVYNDRGIKKVAVRELSFGCQYGECFSLLGVNGAGKTTTFKMLTGEIKPSKGKVHINGYNVLDRHELSQARKYIGYCPQFDALFSGLTVREHLEFYARIKGVIPEVREKVVKGKLKQMDLLEYEHSTATKLSGGNKRKLSVAMAMIGNPPIIFLDEPSTGMDPKAKRFMWSVISNITTLKKKSAVVLTTHSMEEAEALSTKLGIMVSGHFKCFGTVQHLKSKFGNFYEIEFRTCTPDEEKAASYLLNTSFGDDFVVDEFHLMDVLSKCGFDHLKDEFTDHGLGKEVLLNDCSNKGIKIIELLQCCINIDEVTQILKDLVDRFGDLELIEHYGASYKIKLPAFNLSVGKMFEIFEEDYKERYYISDYSVTQATLEQIFNSFAKEQYVQEPPRQITREDFVY